jgi:tetratricopeptide (TPR) repeat protein
MSQLVVPTHTDVDSIPTGRRIREVMKEKGNHYSISSMANRLGINRDTYRTMLNGQRDIYYFELEKIAKDLKTSVGRLLQQDTKGDAETLNRLLDNQEHPQIAVNLARQLRDLSTGVTEKCNAALRVALAHFLNQDYDTAYESANEAQQLALQHKELYGDSELLYRALTLLMDVYTAKRDFENATKILETVEPHFRDNTTRLAALKYLQAKVKEAQGDYESAKALAYDSLHHARTADKPALLGRALLNAAHFEYLCGNYSVSEELLRSAIKELQEDPRSQAIARKELVKSLIKLGAFDDASGEIQKALQLLREIEFPEMVDKLLLLWARSNAEAILRNDKDDHQVQIMASSYLRSYYLFKGDTL